MRGRLRRWSVLNRTFRDRELFDLTCVQAESYYASHLAGGVRGNRGNPGQDGENPSNRAFTCGGNMNKNSKKKQGPLSMVDKIGFMKAFVLVAVCCHGMFVK